MIVIYLYICFILILVADSTRLSNGRTKLDGTRLVQGEFLYISRWNGSGKDYSDHLLPESAFPFPIRPRPLPLCGAPQHHDRLAKGVSALGSWNQCRHLPRRCFIPRNCNHINFIPLAKSNAHTTKLFVKSNFLYYFPDKTIRVGFCKLQKIKI